MSRHLIVMAAGTGGHVMPGLAVADEMLRRGWTVSWIGTEQGMENALLRHRQLRLDRLAFSGMRGKGMGHAIKGGLRLIGAVRESVRIIGERKPAAVFGTGGYVCVPAGLAAWMRRVPIVLLNADSTLLMSNKVLAPLAARIAFGFPADHASHGDKGVWTGNPVRANIAALDPAAQRYAHRTGPLQLLVVGGSLGATVLNETLPRALALLPADQRPAIVHQAGERHIDNLRAAYATQGVQANVLPFIDDMAAEYARADLVICRAGAITVSELCTAGVASLLVPLEVSTTAHQVHNAQFMAKSGAAMHVAQSDFTPAHVARLIVDATRDDLAGMAHLASMLAKPDATQAVAQLIEEVAQ